VLADSQVRDALAMHRAFDAIEAAHVSATLRFIDAHPLQFWSRANLVGHLTASAFVVNHRRTHALLLHHSALGKWLQPGGHIDDADASTYAAARRETLEETAAVLDVDTDPRLFDVDVHPIPARLKDGRTEPAHVHYDLRYLFVAQAESVKLSAESTAFEWVDISQLADGEASSGITRMARRLLLG